MNNIRASYWDHFHLFYPVSKVILNNSEQLIQYETSVKVIISSIKYYFYFSHQQRIVAFLKANTSFMFNTLVDEYNFGEFYLFLSSSIKSFFLLKYYFYILKYVLKLNISICPYFFTFLPLYFVSVFASVMLYPFYQQAAAIERLNQSLSEQVFVKQRTKLICNQEQFLNELIEINVFCVAINAMKLFCC